MTAEKRFARVEFGAPHPHPVLNATMAAAATLLMAAAAVGVDAAPAQEKSYEIGSYDVDVAVRPDGSYAVTERITFRFAGGDFSRIHREIPRSRVDSLTGVEASSPDVAVRQSSVERSGDRLRVRVQFVPARGAVELVLRYRAHGAIQEDDGRNVVHWAAVGDGWEVPVDSVRVHVTLPDAFVGAPDSVGVEPASDVRVRSVDGRWSAQFVHGRLDPSTTYAVRVSFPRAVPGRASGDRSARIFLFSVIAAVAGMLPGLWLSWRWTGPDPDAEPATSGSAAPDLPLALGATLLEVESFSRRGTRLFAALLTDLARRGHLRLERYEEDRLLGTRKRVRARVLEDGPGDDPDAPKDEVVAGIEEELLERLDRHESLRAFRKEEKEFRERVREQLTVRLAERGLVADRSGRARSTRRLVAAGGAAAALTMALASVLGSAPLWELAGLLGGLALGGVFAAARRHEVTEDGGRLRARIRAFIEGRKRTIEAAGDVEEGPRRREAARILMENLSWLILEPGFAARTASELDEELDEENAAILRPGWIRDLTGEEDAAWTAAHAAGAAAASSSAAASGAAGAGAAGAAGGGGGGAA